MSELLNLIVAAPCRGMNTKKGLINEITINLQNRYRNRFNRIILPVNSGNVRYRPSRSVGLEMFKELNKINVNEHTENKNGLTYLSWAWAWAEVMKVCPDANYSIMKFEGNLPYVYDSQTGYMVWTTVTINGITREMWLPVMDANNKAMLDHPYDYQTKRGRMTVNAATMFDINKTIMRCLTKNLAMFGLGLYIYAGEDLPEEEPKAEKVEPSKSYKDQLMDYCKANGIDIREVAKKYKLNGKVEEERFKEVCEDLCKKQ